MDQSRRREPDSLTPHPAGAATRKRPTHDPLLRSVLQVVRVRKSKAREQNPHVRGFLLAFHAIQSQGPVLS